MISKNSVVCILGMHRSGTSSLTGCLESAGLYLGNVVNQAPHNLKGNKENPKTWLINDLVLRHSNGAWDDPPTNVCWNNEAQQLRDNYIQSFDEVPLWGFKDPRCVLTLDFWLEAIANLTIVGTFRHPVAVSKSLARRNGFSLTHSLSLWLHYNRLLLSHLDRTNIQLVNFDLPRDQYLHSVNKVVQTLDLDGDSENCERTFFDTSLRQHSADNSETENLPDEVKNLYRILCDLSDKAA